MSEPTQAEEYLLTLIRGGDAEGWEQLVERYQGRLVAFAKRQARSQEDAEDLVQDTFLNFLKGLDSYRQQTGLESYLFSILRRKIIDRFRGQPLPSCSLQDSASSSGDLDGPDLGSRMAAADPSASWYVQRDEASSRLRGQLVDSLRSFVERLKGRLDFRSIKLADLIFYAQIRNQDIARRMDMNEKQIALIKHRFLKRMAGLEEDESDSEEESRASVYGEIIAEESLLTAVWEQERPSCPKRSTVGAFILGTLDSEWQDYVDFHLNVLGCRFCRANLDDLEEKTCPGEPVRLHARIMQSSVGFLKKT